MKYRVVRFWPVFAAVAAALPVHADSIGSPFAPYYNLTQVSRPAGLEGGYPTGGILIDPSDLNSLFIAEFAEYEIGEMESSAVVRDPATQNIIGFTGALTPITSIPYADAGLVYGPGGDLFFTQNYSGKIGEVPPGSSSPNYVSTPAASTEGGLAFVPAGFAGAGNAAISNFGTDSICSVTVTLQGNGSYAFGPCTDTVNLGYSPEGIVYVAAGATGFSANSILIENFSNSDSLGQVVAYQTDANGMPILSTASTLLTGIADAEGIALDPVSGDIIVDPYNDNIWDVLTPNVAPEPASTALAGGGLLALALFRRKK